MIRKFPLYKILSAIHVIFFMSMLCFGITIVSGTLLALPAIAASFQIGKEWLYDELDVTDSVILGYLRYFKAALCLLRFLPVSLMGALNLAGIWAAARLGSPMYAVACIAVFSLLFTLEFYIAGYHTFVSEEFKLVDAAVAMLVKPVSVITILIVMVLCTYFFSGTMAAVLFFAGSFFLFVIEVVIFVTMLYYLKISGQLKEEDKFAYLVSEKKK